MKRKRLTGLLLIAVLATPVAVNAARSSVMDTAKEIQPKSTVLGEERDPVASKTSSFNEPEGGSSVRPLLPSPSKTDGLFSRSRVSIFPHIGYRWFDRSKQVENASELGLGLVFDYNNFIGLETRVGWIGSRRGPSARNLVSYGLFVSVTPFSLPLWLNDDHADFYIFTGIDNVRRAPDNAPDFAIGAGIRYSPATHSRFRPRTEGFYSENAVALAGFELSLWDPQLDAWLAMQEKGMMAPVTPDVMVSSAAILETKGALTRYLFNRVTFPDIQGHWSQSDVEDVASYGVVHGREIYKGENIFDPGGNLSRIESSKMIVLATEMYKLLTSTYLTIQYEFDTDIDGAVPVDIAIYDENDQKVRTLIAQYMQRRGVYEIDWNGLNDRGHFVRPGIYTVVVDVHSGDHTTISDQGVVVVQAKRILAKEFAESREGLFADVTDKHWGQQYLNESLFMGIVEAPRKVDAGEAAYFDPKLPISKLDFLVSAGKALSWLDGNRRDLSYYFNQLGFTTERVVALRRDQLLTRAEAAAILARLIRYRSKAVQILDPTVEKMDSK